MIMEAMISAFCFNNRKLYSIGGPQRNELWSSSLRKRRRWNENENKTKSLPLLPSGKRELLRLQHKFVIISLVVLIINHHSCLASTTANSQSHQQQQQLKQRLLFSRSLRTSSNATTPNNSGQYDTSNSNNPSSQVLANVNKQNKACPPTVNNSVDYLATPDSQQHNRNESFEFGAAPENISFGFTQTSVSDFVKPAFYTLRLKVDPSKRKFSGQLMISLEITPPTLEQFQAINTNSSAGTPTATATATAKGTSTSSDQQQQEEDTNVIARDKNGELGYRYLTLHAGANIRIKKAFYVYTTRGSLQIPATKIGKNVENELLTLDYYPNVITGGQGLLLIVYAGAVNETDSHGLFFHHGQKGRPRAPSSVSVRTPAGDLTGAQTQPGLGLATQMQPNFARRLLPAWDEPQLKARFSLIVVLPYKNYITLSNMAQKRKSISVSCSGEPLQEIEFHTTPTMSTYLLTLVIGRFDFIEAITQNNLRVRAYVYSNLTSLYQVQTSSESASGFKSSTTSSTSSSLQDDHHQLNNINNKRSSARLALETAIRSFDYLESSLGVKYPLSKFDMVALRDFDNGGMENWGLSLFRESYFLCDMNSTQLDIQLTGGRARSRKVEVPLVIAHEIAHQWFGNLVTSKSWAYLWLNEGFAQLLMYDVANSLFPMHNYWFMLIEDIRQSAMIEDELITSSRALEFEISQPSEQIILFDKITYNKGAMVVKMLQSLLGREQFNAGLRHYLLKHSYDSVTSHDLWVALEESTGRAEHQIENLMRGWLSQEGYPLLSVQVSEEGANYKLRLSQERFTLLKIDYEQIKQNNSMNSEWVIPIVITSELNPNPSDDLSSATFGSKRITNGFLFSERNSVLILPKASVGSWFKLNFNATGYFRVDYESSPTGISSPQSSSSSSSSAAASFQSQSSTSRGLDMLRRLELPIKRRLLGPVDRFNLVDDLFAMVRSGRKGTLYYLRYLIEVFEDETEIIVFRLITEALKRIKQAIVSNSPESKLNSLFDIYVQEYLRRVSEAVRKERGQLMSRINVDVDSEEQDDFSPNTFANYNSNNKQSRIQQLQRLKEIEDLISATRIHYNDKESLRKAADLFTRDFRQSSSSSSTAYSTSSLKENSISIQKQQTMTSLDSMDRELRASIYTAALVSNGPVDLPADISLREQLKFNARYPPGVALINSPSISNSKVSINSTFTIPNSNSNSIPSPNNPTSTISNTSIPESDLFLKLLRAYETSESNAERFAISAALGSVNQPQKQAKLLELTLLDGYFRPAEAVPLLEAMGRSRTGRHLIWEQLLRNNQMIERRQLLNVLLRSLSSGLIEPATAEVPVDLLLKTQASNSNEKVSDLEERGDEGVKIDEQNRGANKQQIVERKLRYLFELYGSDYGKSISQLIENVRINSLWFKRDHDNLVQYLTTFAATLPVNNN